MSDEENGDILLESDEDASASQSQINVSTISKDGSNPDNSPKKKKKRRQKSSGLSSLPTRTPPRASELMRLTIDENRASRVETNQQRRKDGTIQQYKTALFHDARPVEIAFSPDKSHLASGCDDGSVHIWNYETGDLVHSWQEHKGAIWALKFSPAGDLASGSEDKTTNVYHPTSGELLHTFDQHNDEVTCLAYSPDGKILATGSMDWTVKVWHCNTTQLINNFDLHEGSVWAIAFSPDGTMIASASKDRTVKLFRPSSGELLFSFSHADMVTSLAWAPDGQYLASGSWDKLVKVWDVPRGRLHCDLDGHKASVDVCEFSPNGHTLASAADDQTVKVWNPLTGELLHTLDQHTNKVASVKFSPDGECLATASHDNTIKLWVAQTGALLHTFEHSERTNWVTFSPDGNTIASASDDQTVCLWRPGISGLLKTWDDHKDQVYCICFSPDGAYVAAGCDDGVVKVWETGTGKCILTFSEHVDPVWYLNFSQDGETVCSSSDRAVKVWIATVGEVLHSFEVGSGKKVTAASFGKDVALASDDNAIKLFSGHTGEELASFEGHTDTVTLLAFSPDCKFLASGSEDKTVIVWDLEQLDLVFTVPHLGRVRSVVWSSDSTYIASGAKDHIIRVFRGDTGDISWTFESHAGAVNLLAFSPDTSVLVSGSYDKTVKSWDLSTGELICSFDEHRHYVTSLVFSPDGRTVASGSWDKTVKVFDPVSADLIQSFDAHQSTVTAVAFSPDGSTLVSGSWDRTVKLWDPTTRQPAFADAYKSFFVNCKPPRAEKGKRPQVTSSQRKQLQAIVDRFPNIVNITDHRRRTLLHYACESRRADLVSILLSSPNSVGILTPSLEGESVLDICLSKAEQPCLELLLSHIPEHVPIVNREPLTTALPRLLSAYPKLVLKLLNDLGLERSDPIVRQNCERLPLKSVAVAGSPLLRAPRLWEKVFYGDAVEKDDAMKPIEMQEPASPHAAASRQEVQEGVPVTSYVIGLPNLAAFYPREKGRDDNPLAIIQKHKLVDILATDIIRHVLDFKWKQFGKRYFLLDLFQSLLYLSLFSIITLLPRAMPSDYGDQTSTANQYIRMVLDIVFVVFTLFMSFKLGRDIYSNGVKTHLWLSSNAFWNMLDVFIYALVLATATLLAIDAGIDTSPDTAVDILEAITAVLLWMKLLSFAKGFETSGPFVRMTFKVMGKLVFFLVILAIAIVAFAHGFFLLFRGATASVLSRWDVLLKTYQVMLGDFQIISDEFGKSSAQSLAIIFFVIFTLFVVLILLNLLVALMLDIYSSIQKDVKNEWLLERAGAILNLEATLPHSVTHEQSNTFPKWVHVLKLTRDEEEETLKISDVNDRIAEIDERIAQAELDTQQNAQDLHAKIDSLMLMVKSIHSHDLKTKKANIRRTRPRTSRSSRRSLKPDSSHNSLQSSLQGRKGLATLDRKKGFLVKKHK